MSVVRHTRTINVLALLSLSLLIYLIHSNHNSSAVSEHVRTSHESNQQDTDVGQQDTAIVGNAGVGIVVGDATVGNAIVGTHSTSKSIEITASSSVDSNNNNDDNDDRPKLILHFGPMKTGTSTLQYALKFPLTDDLEHDGWHYVRNEEAAWQARRSTPEGVQTFVDALLNDYHSNTIFSSEPAGILERETHLLESVYTQLREQFQVTLVVGYRPFHEWSRSLWYQSYTYLLDLKPMLEGSIGEWKDERTGDFFKVESPETIYWRHNTETIDDIRFSQTLFDAADQYNVPKFVLDLYAGVTETFCCDAIEAMATCETVRTTTFRSVNAGHVSHVYAVAIAFAAASQGLIDLEKYNRLQVWEAIFAQFDKLGQPPVNCPDQAFFDDLSERTLRLDRHVMQHLYLADDDNGRVEMLRDGIQSAIVDGKYCFVDTDAVLAQSDWKTFLQQFAYQ